MTKPRISIVVPIHDMQHGEFFLWRLISSVLKQTFKDYELVIVKEGKMAENTNAGIKKATGELIKILYLDDYFAHDMALQEIVDNFTDTDQWLVTGCLHQERGGLLINPHYPTYSEEMHLGLNTIGSPSVLTIRNEGKLYFDENLSFLLDCDLYKRYFHTYGQPKIVTALNVVIGIGEHQMTNILSDETKEREFTYLAQKYA